MKWYNLEARKQISSGQVSKIPTGMARYNGIAAISERYGVIELISDPYKTYKAWYILVAVYKT